MPRQKLPTVKSSPLLPRNPDGRINNCAIANGAPAADCQICKGQCPDEASLAWERFEQPAPNARAMRLRVTWGDETIQPVQYNVFHTGSIEIEVDIRPGEDVKAVYAEVWAELEQLGGRQYLAKRDGFLGRLADTAKTVRSRAANPTR